VGGRATQLEEEEEEKESYCLHAYYSWLVTDNVSLATYDLRLATCDLLPITTCGLLLFADSLPFLQRLLFADSLLTALRRLIAFFAAPALRRLIAFFLQRREREIEQLATGNGEEIMRLNDHLRKVEQVSATTWSPQPRVTQSHSIFNSNKQYY
jgi:antibiotic biosynthesis monooxygenase (ABM) superfamily enzyme